MRIVSLVVALLGVAACVVVYSAEIDDNPNADPEYREFKRQFGIGYRSKAKEQQKYAQFKRNKAKIEEHNAKYEQGESSYTMGLNQFGDSTLEEVSESNFGLTPPDFIIEESDEIDDDETSSNKRTASVGLLKESWDWRANNGVSPVKNQRSCGSCWAFAVVGVLESQYLIKKKQSVSLSEQLLVNCAGKSYNSYGCNGGWPASAMRYVKASGTVINDTVPYTARDGSCKSVSGSMYGKSGTIRSFIGKDLNTVKNAIYTYGPCTAALYVGDDLVLYKSGIFNNKPDIDPKQAEINHAVIIVGYGKENGKEYFIVKNSWASTWGEKGYFKVEITPEDQLQIGKYVVCYEMTA